MDDLFFLEKKKIVGTAFHLNGGSIRERIDLLCLRRRPYTTRLLYTPLIYWKQIGSHGTVLLKAQLLSQIHITIVLIRIY